MARIPRLMCCSKRQLLASGFLGVLLIIVGVSWNVTSMVSDDHAQFHQESQLLKGRMDSMLNKLSAVDSAQQAKNLRAVVERRGELGDALDDANPDDIDVGLQIGNADFHEMHMKDVQQIDKIVPKVPIKDVEEDLHERIGKVDAILEKQRVEDRPDIQHNDFNPAVPKKERDDLNKKAASVNDEVQPEVLKPNKTVQIAHGTKYVAKDALSKDDRLAIDVKQEHEWHELLKETAFAPMEILVAEQPTIVLKKYVYLDFLIDSTPLDFIKIEMFIDDLPRTTLNFETLCHGSHFHNTQKELLSYAGSSVHRLIPGFMMQSGMLQVPGEHTVFGDLHFDDEDFSHKHVNGSLSMANAGPNTNGSQFFITFGSQTHLDGGHVVFGQVVEGWKALDAIEKVETDVNDKPLKSIMINSCSISDL